MAGHTVTVTWSSGPLSLAIPLWVGEMSIGGGFGHHWGRNGEFFIAVGSVASTAGILTYCIRA